MMIIERGSAYADKLRQYDVELDGEIIGKIGDSENKTFEVRPGSHTLRLRIDWVRSNTLSFIVAQDESIHIRCSSRLKGANVILAVVYALLMPHKYIILERIG